MVGLIKHIAPAIASSAAFETFLSLLEHTGKEKTNLLRVLTYHRVDDPTSRPWLDRALISATPDGFETQVKYLVDNYEVISAVDVIQAFDSEKQMPLPPRAVMITFDDAYCDFAEHAWPILKKHNLPVTLFVPTSFPDHPERLFWWDRLYNALHTTKKEELETPVGRFPISTDKQRRQVNKRLKDYIKTLPNDVAMKEVDQICDQLGASSFKNCVLNWDSLRKLHSEGVTIGAHTQSHPIMDPLTHNEMCKETQGSKKDLERELNTVPLVFAYPSGIHNEDAVNVVKEAGFSLAFTTERGINQIERADRFRLQRINVSLRATIPILRAQLLLGKFVSLKSLPFLKKR